jgi:energy-coupling factor transport system ATP-binding protein
MAGTVTIDGRRTDTLSKTDLARRVDAVLEDPDTQIIGLSVEEDIAFGCENLAMEPDVIRTRVERMLDRFDLAAYRDRDPRHLSGGEKQRLALASAIATEPRILMLDEPVSQLDPAGSTIALDVIAEQKRQGTTIVLLARKLGRAMQLADRVVALEDAQVVVDTTPEAFLDDRATMEELGMWFPAGSPSSLASSSSSQRPEPNLELRNVWHSYDSNGPKDADVTWALEDVSLTIPKGRVVGLVGHNGSGKTTLAKQLNRLYTPNDGTVAFRGTDITGESSTDVAGEIGYVFQNPDTQLFTTTVRKEVSYGPENMGYDDVEERVERALDQVSLGHLVDGRIGTLSRGQKQRVAIASVLALEPEVLILDEPSSGIDYRMFWEIMGELVDNYLTPDRSLVVISHDANVVRQWADVVIEMDDGRVVRQVATGEIPDGDHWGGNVSSPAELAAVDGVRPAAGTDP